MLVFHLFLVVLQIVILYVTFQEMRKTREYQSMPFVIFELEESNVPNYLRVAIRNIGRGPALKLNLKDPTSSRRNILLREETWRHDHDASFLFSKKDLVEMELTYHDINHIPYKTTCCIVKNSKSIENLKVIRKGKNIL